MVNKFIKGTVLIEEALKDMGLVARDVSLNIRPMTEDQQSKTSGCWNRDVWNLDAYENLSLVLEENNFKADKPISSSLGHNSVFWKMAGSDFRLYVKVELSKEDECAKLKARLAELGCHY